MQARNMDSFFLWIEESALNEWITQSPSLFAFPAILAVHTIGMAFLAGTNAAIDLRILGFAPAVPLSAMERFTPVMRIGLWLNVLSGILLLIGYPTKAFTNPVFYYKLGFIALALFLTSRLRHGVIRNPDVAPNAVPGAMRVQAAASLLLWLAAITAGRLLAYTYTRLTVFSVY
jgi:hypothetical protein